MAAGFVHLLEPPPPVLPKRRPLTKVRRRPVKPGESQFPSHKTPEPDTLIRWVGLFSSKQAKDFSHIVLQFILPNLHLFLPGPHSILPDLQLFLLDLHILQPSFKLIEI